MHTLAAIAFDPNIRGALVVATGVVVLIGSIYLIVATNTGVRAGLLIVLAALTGWCFSMGLVWWMYGIGLRGQDPSWIEREVNFSRDDSLVTEVANSLPRTEDLPDPLERYQEIIAENPAIQNKVEASEGQGFEPDSLTKLATLVPEFKEELDDDLGGWRLLPESDARRGDAVAAADATLVDNEAFGQQTAGSYSVKDVFFYGGKGAAEPETIPGERNIFQRAWNRIVTTFQVKNPPLYAAVTVQKNEVQVVAPGEAPPPPEVDEEAAVVTVVLERDLGNRRAVPAAFALITGVMFAVFCWLLHSRDKRAMAARADWKPAKAG
jgi:hypothetical protein